MIAPWNFPLAILTGMTSAALVSGNCVIVKPAGPTPVIAAQLVRILHEAGAPPGVVNYLPSPGGTVGDALVRHPDVELIAFTGSKDVGLHIIEQAAKNPSRAGVKREPSACTPEMSASTSCGISASNLDCSSRMSPELSMTKSRSTLSL